MLRNAKLQDEVERANRVLGGGFGSYVCGTVAPGMGEIPGALAGQAVGYAAQPFSEKESAEIYRRLEKRATSILREGKV
jgi:hypothetical protein